MIMEMLKDFNFPKYFIIKMWQICIISPFNASSHKKGENMKLKPLFDRVLLKKVEDNQSASSIISVPKHTPDEYVVVALGTGGQIDNNDIKFVVKVGDHVLFNKYLSSDFCLEKEEYTIVKQEDIIAIIDKGENK